MRQWVARMTLNQRLAGLAFVLGLVALAAAPYRGSAVMLDAKELAVVVQKELDHVAPLDLAAWIIEGRSDYRLVDIRTDAEFQRYHIPTAENIPLAALADAGLGRQERIVLYSEGGIHAAQAWMLLKALGYRGVYILRGSLEGWKDEVLFPAVSAGPSGADAAREARLRQMSAYFGGTPSAGGTAQANAQAPAMPKVEPPSGASGASNVAAKKKKEGC
jgi:rhodanese-related sulfurtransferase